MDDSSNNNQHSPASESHPDSALMDELHIIQHQQLQPCILPGPVLSEAIPETFPTTYFSPSPSSASSFSRSTHDYVSGSRKRRDSTEGTVSKGKYKSDGEKLRHFFSLEQDEFLAKKILDPRVSNIILQGSRERGQAVPSKGKIYQEIATEFNERFDASVDAPQIKNKIAHMRKLWYKADEIVAVAGYERYKSDRQLQETVQNTCSFYKILCLTWSSSSRPMMSLGGRSVNIYDPIEEIPSDAYEDHLLDRPVLEVAVLRNRDERYHKKARKTPQNYEEAIREFGDQDDPILQTMDREHTRRHDSEKDIARVNLQIQEFISGGNELQLEYDLMIARERTKQAEFELEIEKLQYKRFLQEGGQ
ncbi:hypothetical protein BGZ65_011458 [Modicella reniformis]|uniref:Uncharacterized protein n=1 Tax=Modicella reniformis TaxID=1440133 RepID=A0A9P6MAQ6_9FUNG|nr:hypothetical protein BGZ65_011458 [Modicella reniformis]